MSNKKYYWLKLKDDFFKSREIKKLRKVAGGDTYTIIYLKMQLLSIKNDGVIIFEGTENDITEQLALELDEGVEDVKLTFAFLTKNKMVEYLNQEEYLLNKVPELIGSETDAAERMRKMREKKRNFVTPLLQKVTQRKEIEIEIDNNNKNIVQSDDLNQEKKLKKDIEIFFEKLWKAYPSKRGKGKVKDKQKKVLFKIGQEIIRCIERYKKDKQDWKEYQNGSTFFNGGYVDYLDKNYDESAMESTIPKQGFDLKSKIPQHNFDQREYDSSVYDQFLSNKKEED